MSVSGALYPLLIVWWKENISPLLIATPYERLTAFSGTLSTSSKWCRIIKLIRFLVRKLAFVRSRGDYGLEKKMQNAECGIQNRRRESRKSQVASRKSQILCPRTPNSELRTPNSGP